MKMTRKKKMGWIIILPGLFLTTSAWSRWARPKEAPYAVNLDRTSYDVKADGTYEVSVEHVVKILTDSARSSQGLTRYTFDAHGNELKILKAETVNGKKVIPVDPKQIEIKPLASSGEGFDDKEQATIAFPEVKVGSKLILKYWRRVNHPQVPGLFTIQWPIGLNELDRRSEIDVKSERPIYFEIHDSGNHFEVRQGRKGNKYFVKIRQISPLYFQVLEENSSHLNPKQVPWIAVSTIRSWAEYPRSAPLRYESVIDSKLPPKFAAIVNKARSVPNVTDQINLVTSSVQSLLRYVGDWIPVDGAFYPRPLKQIAKTEFGDCKDFTVVTAAILRHLGFDVSAAWIHRGNEPETPPLKLPVDSFNHAIVHATKNGREFWIDPTNIVSFAQGIFPDIAGRPALVLSSKGTALKRTPAMRAKNAQVGVTLNLRFGPSSDNISGQGEINLRGRSAISMTGSGLSYSRQQLDYTLANWLLNADQLKSWSFSEYDLKSRIVRDLKFKFRLNEMWHPAQTSLGLGYLVQPPPMVNEYLARTEDRVSDLEAGEPQEWHRKITFSGRHFLLNANRSCHGKSRWLRFSRRFQQQGKDQVVLVDDVAIRRPTIPISDMRSPAFSELQHELVMCMQEAVVISGESDSAPRAPAKK